MLNPYTTVDVLVKRLLGITENREWIELNEWIKLPNVELLFELINNRHLKITFVNKNTTVFVLNAANFTDKLYCVDANYVQHNLSLQSEVFTLPPNQKGHCLFTLPDIDLVDALIHFRIGDYLLFLPISLPLSKI